MEYHHSVLLNESVEGLQIRPGGTYVDVTFGGGGHSRAILEKLENGHLIVFDQDTAATANRPDDKRLIFVQHNFRFLRHFLHYYQYPQVDGILADLGVSSHHFDTPERGFSIRFDAPLDMRMNTALELTAARVVNTYAAAQLEQVFRQYGEVDNARRIVGAIIAKRQEQPLVTTGSLMAAITSCIPRQQEQKYLARVFQALRIEVNGEMNALREMLAQTPECLRPGGRLVVISYHSLEDRMVKNFMRSGNFEGKTEQDHFGNIISPWTIISRKAIVPEEEEIKNNNRARSAKLRIAARTA